MAQVAAMSPRWKLSLIAGGCVALLVIAGVGWYVWAPSGPRIEFVSGNGRIEATEVDVASKLPGRVNQILVQEGDFVEQGQPLAEMQSDSLLAQLDEARAQSQHAIHAVASAKAQVAMRTSDVATAQSAVVQRESDLDAAQRRFARSETLTKGGMMSQQELDDDHARVQGALAAVTGANSQVESAQAAVTAAQSEVVGAGSNVTASQATIARIQVDITDCQLLAPRAGRVQYLIAQSGEVLAGGGKILNLVDLSDVYMTFFVTESVAGRVPLGSEVHIILDAAPQFVIPAQVTFVASTAQFTPKTVETASERQKLMFRVKAQIKRELLIKHRSLVKTGLPGMAWLKLDAKAAWPVNLAIKVPE
jgi:HlyD family secretion protein